MNALICKTCPGTVMPDEDNPQIGYCNSCGNHYDLPKNINNEVKVGLYNRANKYRMAFMFQDAITVYQEIIKEDPQDEEAYWGTVLCRFGIEFVQDPRTEEYLPTCHRIVLSPIFQDPDYQLALEHATPEQKKAFEEKANAIARVQKDLNDISRQQAPYDIFICYKETDDSKARTNDSVRSQQLYDALTAVGYRVFFARITLEDTLGEKYEPLIFSALQSAKVMLTVGSSQEFFNAPWVKNEWSRFLSFMKEDTTKKLYPCYFNMDPYEIPLELASLQAQDLNKVGCEQDLVRNIQKIIPLKKTTTPDSPTGNLLARVANFLEDQDWVEAKNYCSKILDTDVECSQAYLLHLCAEYQISSPELLPFVGSSFEGNNHFQKAMRYGSPTEKTTLQGYVDAYKQEQARLEEAHRQAQAAKLEAQLQLAKDSLAAGNWNQAINSSNVVLSIDQTHLDGHMISICASFQLSSYDQIATCPRDFRTSAPYQCYCALPTAKQDQYEDYFAAHDVLLAKLAAEAKFERERQELLKQIQAFEGLGKPDWDTVIAYVEQFKKASAHEESHAPFQKACEILETLQEKDLEKVFPDESTSSMVYTITNIYDGCNPISNLTKKLPGVASSVTAFSTVGVFGLLSCFPWFVSIPVGLFLISLLFTLPPFVILILLVLVVHGLWKIGSSEEDKDNEDNKDSKGKKEKKEKKEKNALIEKYIGTPATMEEMFLLIDHVDALVEQNPEYQDLQEKTYQLIYYVGKILEHKHFRTFPATTVACYERISGFEDSQERLESCKEKCSNYAEVEEAVKEKSNSLLKLNQFMFSGVLGLTIVLPTLAMTMGERFDLGNILMVGFLLSIFAMISLVITTITGLIVGKMKHWNDKEKFKFMLPLFVALYVVITLIIILSQN